MMQAEAEERRERHERQEMLEKKKKKDELQQQKEEAAKVGFITFHINITLSYQSVKKSKVDNLYRGSK